MGGSTKSFFLARAPWDSSPRFPTDAVQSELVVPVACRSLASCCFKVTSSFFSLGSVDSSGLTRQRPQRLNRRVTLSCPKSFFGPIIAQIDKKMKVE